MWEYGIMAQTITLHEGIENLDSDRIAEDFMAVAVPGMRQINAALQNPPPGVQGPMEIVSHDIVRLGSTLLLTTVIRYKK